MNIPCCTRCFQAQTEGGGWLGGRCGPGVSMGSVIIKSQMLFGLALLLLLLSLLSSVQGGYPMDYVRSWISNAAAANQFEWMSPGRGTHRAFHTQGNAWCCDAMQHHDDVLGAALSSWLGKMAWLAAEGTGMSIVSLIGKLLRCAWRCPLGLGVLALCCPRENMPLILDSSTVRGREILLLSTSCIIFQVSGCNPILTRE